MRVRFGLPALLVFGMLLLTGCTGPAASPDPTSAQADSPRTREVDAPPAQAELDTAGLDRLRQLQIFFAHRSVGGDIVELGIPAIFEEYGSAPLGDSYHDRWLDQTDDPVSKLVDFDRWIRGEGIDADIALMKLGYIDVVADTDVQRLFDEYRSTLDALEMDFPNIVFLHATVSVTAWVPENNAAIERFNMLMREQYAASGRLYDLAAVVSTCADGTWASGETEAGDLFFRICDEYTRDGGHLNDLGARVAATELLRILIDART